MDGNEKMDDKMDHSGHSMNATKDTIALEPK
jgi:hypothetical protein